MDLQKILADHKKWIAGNGGERAFLYRADLRGANLRGADLSDADLSDAYLCGADLCRADLRGANLRGADLRRADLRRADLRDADLCDANLSDADLSDAYLCGADLCRADLRGANLRGADLSGAKNLLSAVDFMENNFEKTEEGYIAYKCFNAEFEQSKNWKIERGSVISENVNYNRTNNCGCGINVAPFRWVKYHYAHNKIWRVLIRWEWLCGVCVPYNTDGKIRCERVELIDIVKGENENV